MCVCVCVCYHAGLPDCSDGGVESHGRLARVSAREEHTHKEHKVV